MRIFETFLVKNCTVLCIKIYHLIHTMSMKMILGTWFYWVELCKVYIIVYQSITKISKLIYQSTMFKVKERTIYGLCHLETMTWELCSLKVVLIYQIIQKTQNKLIKQIIYCLLSSKHIIVKIHCLWKQFNF